MLRGIDMFFLTIWQAGKLWNIFQDLHVPEKKNTLCALISICRVGYLHIALIQYKKCKCKKNIYIILYKINVRLYDSSAHYFRAQK